MPFGLFVPFGLFMPFGLFVPFDRFGLFAPFTSDARVAGSYSEVTGTGSDTCLGWRKTVALSVPAEAAGRGSFFRRNHREVRRFGSSSPDSCSSVRASSSSSISSSGAGSSARSPVRGVDVGAPSRRAALLEDASVGSAASTLDSSSAASASSLRDFPTNVTTATLTSTPERPDRTC